MSRQGERPGEEPVGLTTKMYSVQSFTRGSGVGCNSRNACARAQGAFRPPTFSATRCTTASGGLCRHPLPHRRQHLGILRDVMGTLKSHTIVQVYGSTATSSHCLAYFPLFASTMGDPLSVLGAAVGVTSLIIQLADDCIKGLRRLQPCPCT